MFDAPNISLGQLKTPCWKKIRPFENAIAKESVLFEWEAGLFEQKSGQIESILGQLKKLRREIRSSWKRPRTCMKLEI